MPDLDAVLAQEEADAAALRRKGDLRAAEIVEAVVARVRASAEDWLTWLDEPDAALRSGRAPAWHRARFAAWERQGHARFGRVNGRRVRQYRRAIVPMRAAVATLEREARTAARRYLAGEAA
jgi:hypothetical protein